MTKPNKRFFCNECGDCSRIPPQRNLFAFPPLCFLSGCSLSHSSVSSPPPPPPRKQRNNIKFPFPLINGLFFPPSPLKGTNHSNKSLYSSFAMQLWVWRALGLHPFIFAANNIYCNKAGKEKREESFLVINPSFFSAAAAKASLFPF